MLSFRTPSSYIQKPCDIKYTSLKLEAGFCLMSWKLEIRPANANVGVGLGMNEHFGPFRKRSTISAVQGHRRREADPFPRGSMGARNTTPKFGCLGLSAFSMSSDSCRSWLWILRVYYCMPWLLTVRSLTVLICTRKLWLGGNIRKLVSMKIKFVFLLSFFLGS